MVDLVERLNVLLRQEKTVYRSQDYLSPSYQEKLQRETCEISNLPSCSSSSESSSSSSGINEVWREKICEWSYQVVDHFDFSREVVTVSISYLDRYLSTRQVDKKLFQLAAMTTLYLAIKLYEPGTLSMQSMIELSRGYFMVEQMAVMEMAILQSLSWHVHPPTSFCLSRHILHMLPPNAALGASARHDILELARFLTELSVIDYFFVSKRTSSVALAALLNAMETLQLGQFIPEFLNQLKLLKDLDPMNVEIEECRSRLRELYIQGGYARGPIPATEQITRTDTVSPVCVSAFNRQHNPQPSVAPVSKMNVAVYENQRKNQVDLGATNNDENRE